MMISVPPKRLYATQRQAGRLLGNNSKAGPIRTRDLARFVGQATPADYVGHVDTCCSYSKNWDMRFDDEGGTDPSLSQTQHGKHCNGGHLRSLVYAMAPPLFPRPTLYNAAFGVMRRQRLLDREDFSPSLEVQSLPPGAISSRSNATFTLTP